MSSLAGALTPSPDASLPSGTKTEGPVISESHVPDDIDMLRPVIPPKGEREPKDEQDEEMTDLFGNDNDVEESKPEE
jgi:hypothetical protein